MFGSSKYKLPTITQNYAKSFFFLLKSANFIKNLEISKKKHIFAFTFIF